MIVGRTIAGLKLRVRLCSLRVLVPSFCPTHCHVVGVEVVLVVLTCLLPHMAVLPQAARVLATEQWLEVAALVRPSHQVAVVTLQASQQVCLDGTLLTTILHGVGLPAIEETHIGIRQGFQTPTP